MVLNEDTLVSEVIGVVRAAGDAVMAIYRSGHFNMAFKEDRSPLTEADLASHHAIVRGLNALTPDYSIVSEENDERNHAVLSTRYWLIDPLDGTKEFVARNGEFTINVALIEDGRPVLGFVYAPALDVFYWTSAAHIAYRERNGSIEQISVTDTVSQPTRVVASKSHLNAETEAFVKKLGEVTLVQAGSSLKICLVADGSADIYPRLGPTSEWDTAAAQAVLEAANGVMVDLDLNPICYGKDNILNPYFIASRSLALIPE